MPNEISAIVAVSERYDEIAPLYQEYKNALQQCGYPFQFIYVLDGEFPEVRSELEKLCESGDRIEIVELGKWYGESTALTVALPYATGDIILTLPAYAQVEPSGLKKLIDGLSAADVAIAVRSPRRDSRWNRFQARVFHRLINWISARNYRDLGCGVRAFKRKVLDEVPVYGDLHRFFPLLSARVGFNVVEVDLPQADADLVRRIYRPGVYIRRSLDMLTVFFLVKFTKKPLRFFGLLGTAMAGFGAAVMLWLVIERLFFDVAMGDRPALLLGTLLFAIGIQLFAVGLIGELIIFTHALQIKEYSVEKIVTSSSGDQKRGD